MVIDIPWWSWLLVARCASWRSLASRPLPAALTYGLLVKSGRKGVSRSRAHKVSLSFLGALPEGFHSFSSLWRSRRLLRKGSYSCWI